MSAVAPGRPGCVGGGAAAGRVLIDFTQLGPLANGAVFTSAAAVVWLAGVRLVHVVDAIAERTSLGEAFGGIVLLAGATELPEIATTLAASVADQPQLAVANVFGGVATQTAMLAVADATLAGGALTWFAPRVVLLLQGQLLIVLLALAALAIVLGEPVALGPVGLSPVLLCAVYLSAVWMLRRLPAEERWQPTDAPPPRGPERARPGLAQRTMARLWAGFAGLGATILVAGALLSWSAEALAEQTGLGTTFVGASLLALATSLPELSTTIAAVRIGAAAMAVANIFGSNMLAVALLLPADLAWTSGPILRAVEPGTMLLPLLVGVAVTAFYVIGLVERANRTILRLGYDSIAVLVAWLCGLVALFLAR